ncbi:SMP-30/gluconolactonase/LRE family protein [Tianweitania sp.]|uniref:SMP-30/gluconolactonase/LRE family protein n=1 Tax=Tianweitania sp. TaxID=2021634 RepID=UPI0028978DF3|nr:SMP-30/gluconolactonase/LRE family protein [Tianweitania sp.]
MTLTFRCIADLCAGLTESPVWDDRRGTLFVCDIPGKAIIEIDLAEGVRRQWSFEAEVTALGLCDSGVLVVALARKVIVFDPETETRRDLWTGYDEPQTSRLNDGKVGPDGAFWIGAMDGRADRQPIAKLYRIDAQGQARAMEGGFAVSNGLAWSPDGRILYHSDSRGPWIDRLDFDLSSGEATNRQRVVDLDETKGRPDGGACDADGEYWSAGVSAGVLNRFAADGTLRERIPVPIPAPTMPCFCGPDLKQIAITSHRQVDAAALADAPQSGGVFLAEAPVRGTPVARMKGL